MGISVAANTTLNTVADYLEDARTLLLDTIPAYRYDDASLIIALNVTLLEARRIRPDLFVYRYCGNVPTFTVNQTTAVVYIEAPFRLAILFGLVSHALSRDQEEVQDSRAASYMATFNDILLGLRARPIAGGTPSAAGGN